jgi:hypothetical protein
MAFSAGYVTRRETMIIELFVVNDVEGCRRTHLKASLLFD